MTGRLVRLGRPSRPTPTERALQRPRRPHRPRDAVPAAAERFHEWIETSRKNPNHLNVAIERLEETGAIGLCDLMQIEAPTRTAELGIWIARPWWRGGYGTDAVRTLCRFGFDHMNLHRITLFVNATNTQAIRAYEKAGFGHEGRLRRRLSPARARTSS